MHRRTFSRYVGTGRLRAPEALPLFVGVTRLLGRLRACEELLGERHLATEVRGDVGAVTTLLNRLLTTRLLAATRRRRVSGTGA